jgi:hypothetical protein
MKKHTHGLRAFHIVCVCLLLVISAQGQRQTTVAQVLNASTATGRVVPLPNDLIGAGSSYWTYCTTATLLSVIAEESPDNVSGHFVPISVTYGVPAKINGNACDVIPAGGMFGYPAFNVLAISGGSISVWYSGSVGTVATFPPAYTSTGASAVAQCDQTGFTNVGAGATAQLAAGSTGQQIHICGFTLSFAGSSGNTGYAMLVWGFGTNCGTAPTGISWEIYFNSASTPLDVSRSFVIPAGASLCYTPPGTGTAGNVVSVSYAKF